MPVVTACTWRESDADAWATGTIEFPEEPADDPDGALFHLLTDRSPEAFQLWAQDYYEVEIGLEAVRHVLSTLPLTEAVVNALNPTVTLADLTDDIAEIGYPLA